MSAFTFGVAVTPNGGGAGWRTLVRDLEQRGYTTLLVPDTLRTTSPFPALAAAATVTSTLRLRTWVLAAPFRSPAAVVREAAALQELSDGRFELGLGPGRPEAESEAARLGAHWGSVGERRALVGAVVAAVRDQVHPAPTVIVAARGQRMLADAAGYADRISLAAPPVAGDDDLAALVSQVRASGAATMRLTHQLLGVGDRLLPWATQRLGLDVPTLVAANAAAMLHGDVDQMAATLISRKERLGIDEIIVPGELVDAFAPVLERLT